MYIPSDVKYIINKIEENGFEAYAVGGCVRDSLLMITPHDWDICTSAFPQETKKIFSDFHTVDTGIKHGTVSLIFSGESYEITTFRCDGEYGDNRHPESVTFVRNISEDLSRRDFTVNAMAYSPSVGIVDLFRGKEDLKNKVIRCVGDPDTRFNEDALRIMRALRFASVYGFDIEKKTAEAAVKNRLLLKNISAERINSELCKLIMGKGVKNILENFYDIFTVFLPEFDPESVYDSDENLYIRLAAMADASVLKALKFDNNTVRIAGILRSEKMIPTDKPSLNRLINRIGFEESILLARFLKRHEVIPVIEGLKETLFSLKNLAVKGGDLAEAGIEPGKRTGEILKLLLDKVIEGELENEKNTLLNYLQMLT